MLKKSVTAIEAEIYRREVSMSPKLKKILNRAGLIAMIAGVVAIVVAGGDAESALDTVGKAASLAGALLVFVRELFN